jgi:hypothetical protein
MLRALPERPTSVTWLAAFVLILASAQAGRAVFAWQQRDFLARYPFSPPPSAWLAAGLVFGLLGLASAAGLWLGRRWALRVTAAGGAAFAVYAWLDRLAFSASPLAPANAGFSLVVTLAFLAWMGWTLTRPAARLFFGVNHDRKRQD